MSLIPLTAGGLKSGNPQDSSQYDYMAIDPYDNVKAQDYPHLLVTTGLHDSRGAILEQSEVELLKITRTKNGYLLLVSMRIWTPGTVVESGQVLNPAKACAGVRLFNRRRREPYAESA